MTAAAGRAARERLRVDPLAGDGRGLCAEILPELITLDDWGFPIIGDSLCVPKTSSTSCDQAIFVDQATDASVSSDAVLLKIDRFGQLLQRRGAVQRAVRPVLVMVDLVLAQDPPQMVLVPDQGAVQKLATASPDPALGDRVHPGRPHAAQHGPDPRLSSGGAAPGSRCSCRCRSAAAGPASRTAGRGSGKAGGRSRELIVPDSRLATLPFAPDDVMSPAAGNPRSGAVTRFPAPTGYEPAGIRYLRRVDPVRSGTTIACRAVGAARRRGEECCRVTGGSSRLAPVPSGLLRIRCEIPTGQHQGCAAWWPRRRPRGGAPRSGPGRQGLASGSAGRPGSCRGPRRP